MKTNIYLRSYLAQFFLEREMFETKVAEKIKTHFMFSNSFFFRKSCHLWDNVEKYDTARQAIYDYIIQRMLQKWGYKHTLRTWNTYCFSSATMVARTRIILGYTYIACLAYFKASDSDWDLSVESSPFQNVSYKTRRNVRFNTTFYTSSWRTVTYSGSTEHTMVL
jgi:hypothetical protein